MEDRVFEVVSQTPGIKFFEIRSRVGMSLGDRVVDRALQKLRRNGRIKFAGGGWHAVTKGGAS